MANVVRDRIEIQVEGDTRDLERALDRSQEEIGGLAAATRRATRAMGTAFRGVGSAMSFANNTLGVMTRGLELAKAAAEALGIDMAELSTTIGDLVNAATEEAFGQSLSGMWDGFIQDIKDANSETGKFVRGGLASMVGAMEFVVVGVMRVVQGIDGLIQAIGLADDAIRQVGWDIFGEDYEEMMVERAREVTMQRVQEEARAGLIDPGEVYATMQRRLEASEATARQIVSGVEGEMTTLDSGLAELSASMDSYDDSIAGISDRLTGFADVLRNLGDVEGETEESTRSNTSAVRDQQQELGLLAQSVARLGEVYEQSRRRATDSFDWLGEVLSGENRLTYAEEGEGWLSGIAGSVRERFNFADEGPIGSTVAEFRETLAAEVDAVQTQIDELMSSAVDTTVSALGTAFDGIGRFASATDATFKNLGKSIKGGLGDIFTQIGRSAIASIPARIAAGDPFALLGAVGVAFSFFGGLLSGGGGSTINPQSGGTPEVLQAIRPEYGGNRNVTIRQELQVGAIYSADESARAVDRHMRRAAEHGESVLNQMGYRG